MDISHHLLKAPTKKRRLNIWLWVGGPLETRSTLLIVTSDVVKNALALKTSWWLKQLYIRP